MLSERQLSQLRRIRSMGGRLRYAMGALDLTQEALGERSGVTQSGISRILRDEHDDAMVSTAYKLSGALGCQIEDIFPAPRQAQ